MEDTLGNNKQFDGKEWVKPDCAGAWRSGWEIQIWYGSKQITVVGVNVFRVSWEESSGNCDFWTCVQVHPFFGTI